MVAYSNPLDLVKLTPLMEFTKGRPEIVIGLIDGPVKMTLPDLVGENIQEVPGKLHGACAKASSTACMHGTFVAGILLAKRNSEAPAICPDCTLLVRSIFVETTLRNGQMPSTTPEELVEAIIDCINAGAKVVNLSVSLLQLSYRGERKLEEAMNYAAKHGVIFVAASGNQGTIGSSAITRHPLVIPVVACNMQGRPTDFSNIGSSIGRRGLCAPGDAITSIGADGKPMTLRGTSVAAPFVTGAIALLWSAFPDASAAEIRLATTQVHAQRRTEVVPPLLDAWTAYQTMAKIHSKLP